MKATIVSFTPWNKRNDEPMFLSRRPNVGYMYLGLLCMTRCDSVTVSVDLYVEKVTRYDNAWWPEIIICWVAGEMRLSMAYISVDVDATDNQAALHFLRDYIRDEWWTILNRMR